MVRRTAALVLTVLGAGALAACGSDGGAATEPAAPVTAAQAEPDAATNEAPAARAAQSGTSVLATRLQVPWGVAFLPGGDALVSERTTGRILRVSPSGAKRVVQRIAGVEAVGEGGLLGLAVGRTYAKDRLVYAFYTSRRDNRIVRFKLGGPPRVVFSGIRSAPIHNGGRLAFGPDGKLYVGTGDAGDTSLSQDRRSPNGKVLRLNPDGSIPSSNPFRGSPVFSLGHRNVQGLAFDRAGRLWAPEFGQNTFDEVNLIRRGRNYGWPAVEGRGTGGGRYESPKVVWRTSESSPSGAAIVGSTLYVGALAGRRLWKVPLDGTSAGRPQALLDGRYGRVRSPAAAPDGSLWVTTSNRDGRGSPTPDDDRIVRLANP
ncbi:MAG: putative oxidoreductase [Solirubrobacterales bacterium]|nr:putative oxidoreductase [Solirubrobacterales bacterium]